MVGYPQIHSKPSVLGYHYFRKPPYLARIAAKTRRYHPSTKLLQIGI